MYLPVDADVIIVGGGLAGLTAAYWLHLKEPTLHVIVLEASDRVGGRTYSVPLLIERGKRISYFDISPQWFCKEQSQLLQLLDFLNITYYSAQKRGNVIIHHGSVFKTETRTRGHFNFLSTSEKFQFSVYIIKVEALCRKVKAGCPDNIKELDNITLEYFINATVTSNAVRTVINFLVINSCGIRPNQVSALFYIFYCISTRGICNQLPIENDTLFDLRIEGGTQIICEKLADFIGRDSIYTGEHVKSISMSKRYADVTSGNSTYRSYALIVTVPPKELLNIQFNPNLSAEHVEAVKKTCAGTVTNFVATYERKFWEQRDFSGECFFFDNSKGPIDYCANISTPGNAALAGIIFQGRVTNSKYPVYKNEVLNELALYLGYEALHPVDYCEKSWSNQSCRMLGWQVANVKYFAEIYDPEEHELLFFAGAETSSDWYGHLAGAVNSGIKAAIDALYLIRPAALTSDDMYILSKRRARSTPMKSHYSDSLNIALQNWKMILSVCVVTLFALWKVKS